jgi:hypothetical protein
LGDLRSPEGSRESSTTNMEDIDEPYRYRIFTVKSPFGSLSLSNIIRFPSGYLRIHLLSNDPSLRTTRTDMAPDPSSESKKVIIQTNLLHHYGITRGVMGHQNSHPILPGQPEPYYLNVSDFGPALVEDSTFFDFARYLDRLLIGLVSIKENYELLTGYTVPPGTTVNTEMASMYLKHSFTTYKKMKCPEPSMACSFSFSFYFRPADGNPQLGIFHRCVPKSFRTMEELIALVPRESRVKLILKPCIKLTNNYEGMDEAAQRLYRYEGVPTYSLQVVFQVCTINVDI